MNQCASHDAYSTHEPATGNVPLLLHEIRHALQALLDEGKEAVIDLRSMPLGPSEESRLVQILGIGEICAQLDVLGPGTAQETAFPGVWIITHVNSAQEIVGKTIEITFIPALLRAQKEDIAAGLDQLTDWLNQ